MAVRAVALILHRAIVLFVAGSEVTSEGLMPTASRIFPLSDILPAPEAL